VRRRERAIHVGLLCVVVVLALIGRGRPLLFLGGVVLLQRFVDLRRWRKQEHEADRFAAQRCGAGTMAAALTRMHRLEGLPEDFGESGAELTHPDLVRRLEALGVAAAPAATH
jgi:Zn-dependent protease with chaperone function